MSANGLYYYVSITASKNIRRFSKNAEAFTLNFDEYIEECFFDPLLCQYHVQIAKYKLFS